MNEPRGQEGAEDTTILRWEGEPEEEWRVRWGVPHLRIYGRTSSTNDRLRELARKGVPPLTLILAEEQSRGRGRSGKGWHSPPGVALYLSVLLSGQGREERNVLPLRVGAAVARALERTVEGLSVGIEWPNDLLAGGRKVAGVLCEAHRGEHDPGVVVGIGVNVNQSPGDFPTELVGRAGSLAMAVGRPLSRPRLVGGIVAELKGLSGSGDGGLSDEEWEEISSRDVFRGEKVVLPDGSEGEAMGIGKDGALRVRSEGRDREIRSGSVVPLNRIEPGIEGNGEGGSGDG